MSAMYRLTPGTVITYEAVLERLHLEDQKKTDHVGSACTNAGPASCLRPSSPVLHGA